MVQQNTENVTDFTKINFHWLEWTNFHILY